MKKTIIMIFAIIIQMTAMAGVNQQGGPTFNGKKVFGEEWRDNHTKFIAKMLKLDDATAAKFIPVYKEYMKEMDNLRRAGMKNHKHEKEKLTEAEAAKIIKERLQVSRKLLDIREKYYNKFGKIITALQVKQIYDMEQSFDMRMRGMYGNRKQKH